ncbi:hypothetical protein SRHO_G00060710 [Serrasalmus rhombeus]
MEQEMELRSPPSATAYNCFSKKDRIQERQREEEQQVPKENDVRRLEEMVKQQEMEIARFHKRQERLKQKLEKIKEQLARKEQKTLKIVQTDGPTSGETAEEKPEWGGHDGGEAVIIEVESQQVESAAPSSSGRRMLQRVLSTVRSLVERLRSRSSARCIQAEVEDEHEDVSQPRRLIPLGAPAGVLTVNLKTCRDFSKSAPLKKGSRAAVRITIGRTVKYTMQQPYSDPMCFDEWKHFSLQIQKEDICGVQQSSLVVVELIMVDPDLTTPILIGRDTIMLQEILKKSSLSHQFNLRLMQKKVCKLDADLAFTYGSMGYGYSHQLKHAGRTIESLVEKSLFPRCPPNEDRDPLCNVITPSARTRLDFIPSVMLQDTQTGTECRISAGLKDCIQKRGRLLHLHQGLDECKTGEDRVQFLEKLILKKSFSSSCPC